jgi:hypothetical protein
MASKTISIRLSIDDSQKVRDALRAIGDEGKAALSALEAGAARIAPSMRQVQGGADEAGRGVQRFGQVMGQAGYQVQDFAVQVSSGQSALVAFGQQAPQLLGVFGPAGAIAGAAVTVGVLAAQLLTVGANAATSAKQAEAEFRGVEQSQKDLKKAIEDVNAAYMTQAQRASAAAAAARSSTQATLEQNQSWLVQRNDASATELGAAERNLAKLEAYAQREEAARARMRRNGEMAPEGEAANDRGTLFEARTQVQGLQTDMQRTSARITEVTEALGRLRNAGVTGTDVFGPEAPAGITATANTLRRELDKTAAAREQYASRVTAINANLARGEIDTAEAARLTTLADKERNDALEKLAKSGGAAAAARQAEAAAARDANEADQLRVKILGTKADAEYRYALFVADAAQALQRGIVSQQEYNDAVERNNPLTIEAARILDQIRTPAEKYAEQLERLKVLLEAGKLTQDQFNEAVQRFDPAVKAAEEAAKKQATAVDQANRQVTDSIVRYSADGFADLFDKNGKGWKGMLDTFLTTFRKTMARIAAEAIIRPIVQPIVQSMGLGSTFGSGLATAGASLSATQTPGSQPVLDSSGNLAGYAQQAATMRSASSMFDGGPTMLDPGYDWSGGMVGRFDTLAHTNVGGFLNQPAYSVPWGQGEAAGLGGGPNLAGGGAETGVSVGGAAAGALGVAGGLYGLYSGYKTGGAKGAAQMVGGAAGVVAGGTALAGGSAAVGAGAAGLFGAGAGAAMGAIAAAAPYVAIIAAVVAMLLPAQKPSDKTGTYTFNTRTGEGTEGGLTGDRNSTVNREQAKSFSDGINKLAANVGEMAGLKGAVDAQYRVGVGARDGVQVAIGDYKAQGAYDEAGTTAVMRAVTAKFLQLAAEQTKDENVRKVINASGTGDIDVTMANLDWYTKTYKEMSKTAAEAAATTNQFAESMKALRAPYDEVIAKAESFGLSITEIAAREKDATEKLIANRNAAFESSLSDYRLSIAQMDPNAFWPRNAPEGTGGDMVGMAGSVPTVASITFDRFNQQRNADWNTQKDQITAAGLGDAEIARVRVLFDQMKDLELKATAQSVIRAQEDRAMAPSQYMASLDVGLLRATGQDTAASRLEFETNATASLVKARRDMEDLNLSAQQLAEGMAKATATVQAQRERLESEATHQAQVSAFSSLDALLDREASATGSANTEEGAIWSFERKAILERDAAARDGATDMVQLERTLAAERLAIQKNYAEQAAEAEKAANDNRASTAADVVVSLADYAKSLRTGDASPISARAQYEAAQKDFSATLAGARAGDWNAITGLQSSAEAYRTLSQKVNGSGADYVNTVQGIADALSTVAEMGPDRLTSSVQASLVETQTQRLERAIGDMKAELVAVKTELRQRSYAPPEARAA